MGDGLDMSQVDAFAADLLAAAVTITPAVGGVVKRGALNIKKAMKDQASGVRHAPALARDISYEVTVSAGGATAEIGPTTGDVGSLAFLYFGNSKSGPRLPDPILAGLDEAPAVERFLAKVAINAIRR